MATLDELVSGEVEKYKISAFDDISSKAKTERQYLDEYAMVLEKESNSLLGFKLGITSPGIVGYNSNVIERNPFGFGFAEKLAETVKEPEPLGIFPILIFIGAAYFLLKGKK